MTTDPVFTINGDPTPFEQYSAERRCIDRCNMVVGTFLGFSIGIIVGAIIMALGSP